MEEYDINEKYPEGTMMAILKIVKLGNPILRRVAAEVTPAEAQDPAFQQFLEDMTETMRKLDGVGLAAPQVSVSKQAIVIEANQNPRYPDAPDLPLLIILNPVLTRLADEKIEGWEGCLSVENLRGKVIRSARVGVKGFNRFMEPMELDADGFLAVVFQHEIDHLNGRVFLDRMKDFSTLTHLAEFDRYWTDRPVEV
ncbi:MAG TPA: peptide deformylase [Candidatus Manganitrophaceae bacterium]